LIPLLSRRNRWCADIRSRNALQRNYIYFNAYRDSKRIYLNAYRNSDYVRPNDYEEPIIGYEFILATPADEVTRNLEKLEGSRRRLAKKVQSGEYDIIDPPRKVRSRRTSQSAMRDHAVMQSNSVGLEYAPAIDTVHRVNGVIISTKKSSHRSLNPSHFQVSFHRTLRLASESIVRTARHW
jgi:hypothetical protein